LNTELKSPFTAILYGLPALITAGAIFYVSSLEEIEIPLGAVSFNDLLFHFAAYFFFGLTLIAAAYPWYGHLDYPRQTTFLLIGIGILYGLSDEIHQAFVPNRTCAVSDLTADALGVIFAHLTVKTWIRIRRKNAGSSS